MEPKGDTERKQAVRKPLPFEVCFTDRELYTGICKYLRSGDLSDNLLINACIYTICWIKKCIPSRFVVLFENMLKFFE